MRHDAMNPAPDRGARRGGERVRLGLLLACLAGARRVRARIYAAASWPAQALNLLWVNPDWFTQEDVVFSSGARVYRSAPRSR